MHPCHETLNVKGDVTDDFLNEALQPSRSLSNFSLGTQFNPKVFENLFETTLQPKLVVLTKRRHEETVTGAEWGEDTTTVSDVLKSARDLAAHTSHRRTASLHSRKGSADLRVNAARATPWSPSLAQKSGPVITIPTKECIVDPKVVFDTAMHHFLPVTPLSAAAAPGSIGRSARMTGVFDSTNVTAAPPVLNEAEKNSHFLALRRKRIRSYALQLPHMSANLKTAHHHNDEYLKAKDYAQTTSDASTADRTLHPKKPVLRYSKIQPNKVWSLLDRCVEELVQPSELSPDRLEPDPVPRFGRVSLKNAKPKMTGDFQHQTNAEELSSQAIRDARIEAYNHECLKSREEACALSAQDIDENLKGERFTASLASDNDEEDKMKGNNDDGNERNTYSKDGKTTRAYSERNDSEENSDENENDASYEGSDQHPRKQAKTEESEMSSLLTIGTRSPSHKRFKGLIGSSWVSPALAFSLGLGKELLAQEKRRTDKQSSEQVSLNTRRMSSPRGQSEQLPQLNTDYDPCLDANIELENFHLPIPRRIPLRSFQGNKSDISLRILRHFQASHQQIPQGPADGMLSPAARPHPQTLSQAVSASPLALQLIQHLVPPSLDSRPTKFGGLAELKDMSLTPRAQIQGHDFEIVSEKDPRRNKTFAEDGQSPKPVNIRVDFATQHQRTYDNILSPIARAKKLAQFASHIDQQQKLFLNPSLGSSTQNLLLKSVFDDSDQPYTGEYRLETQFELLKQLEGLRNISLKDESKPKTMKVSRSTSDSTEDSPKLRFQLTSTARKAIRNEKGVSALEKHALRIRTSTARITDPSHRNPWLLKSDSPSSEDATNEDSPIS